MEGAAAPQVCYEHDIPFAVIRIISDKADENAQKDFPNFVNKTAKYFSCGIVLNLLKRL